MSYNSPKSGTVNWTNRVNGSATANISTTSAATFTPFVFGNMTEVVFDSIGIGGALSSNFTGSFGAFETVQNTFIGVQPQSSTNGNSITFQSPINLNKGVYMVEYGLTFGNIRGIIDVTYKINGAGSFSNLRLGVDCYNDIQDSIFVGFREFLTVTTSGSPMFIKWQSNGKNPGSADFWVTVLGPITVTLLG